ncbi:SRPBCC family protein [Actinophytocola sp.]|uniref:SRPBCC family protein n=1 Tax=Actinophytocola sp. TaxID=1872138 RepID=UPI003D6A806B
MTTRAKDIAVDKTVTVRAGRERAFTVFTERFHSWWPGHHIGGAELADVIIEPREGGRWYEHGVDGSECDWGRVLAWEPPARLVLSWHLRADFSYEPDPAKASEIEVRFVAEAPDRTRVEFSHHHIERHDDPDGVVEGVDSPGGWTSILAAYAELVA